MERGLNIIPNKTINEPINSTPSFVPYLVIFDISIVYNM